jgi:hypothetical protein
MVHFGDLVDNTDVDFDSEILQYMLKMEEESKHKTPPSFSP